MQKEQRLQLAEFLRGLSKLLEADQITSCVVCYGDSSGFSLHHVGDGTQLGFLVRKMNYEVEHAVFGRGFGLGVVTQ